MEIKRKRKKIGDLVALELPDGKFTFYRVFPNISIGVYEYIGEDMFDIPKKEVYQFIVSTYNDVRKAGVIIDNIPFPPERENLLPLTHIRDVFNPKKY